MLGDEKHHGRVKAGRRGAVTTGLTDSGLSLADTIQFVPKDSSAILSPNRKRDETNDPPRTQLMWLRRHCEKSWSSDLEAEVGDTK